MPKIKDNHNPATWMLEVSSASVEAELGIDFATIYKESSLYRWVYLGTIRAQDYGPWHDFLKVKIVSGFLSPKVIYGNV